MKIKRKTSGIRVLSPSGAHKSYRFQRQTIPDGPWETISNDEIVALNGLVKDGTLTQGDIEGRVALIKASLYLARDGRPNIDLLLPGNVRILNDFLKKTYTESKKTRMENGSFESSVYYLQNGLLSLGNIPIDGDLEAIQNKLDKTLKAKPNIHKKRVAALNRLRKWLILPPILHLKKDINDVKYLTEKEVMKLIDKAESPAKELIAAAWYTGLRLGELHALTERAIKSATTLLVTRQIDKWGNSRLPKYRKQRKAYMLPGGVEWVHKWLAVKSDMKRNYQISNITQELAGVRFHDLRHSYAVYLLGKGATLSWVAQSLGHSTDVCERYYAGHVLADDAIELMNRLVGKSSG